MSTKVHGKAGRSSSAKKPPASGKGSGKKGAGATGRASLHAAAATHGGTEPTPGDPNPKG